MKTMSWGIALAALLAASPAVPQSQWQNSYNKSQWAPRRAIMYPDWEARVRIRDGKAYMPYYVPVRGYPILAGGRVFDLRWRRVR